MTLSEARRQAAAAIRMAAGSEEIVRVEEVDVINPRDLAQVTKGLTVASERKAGDMGPAVVAVMAYGRSIEQTITITAFTIIRDRLTHSLTSPGRGRGLAVVDTVETALRGLAAHNLEVETEALQLPASVHDTTLNVFATRLEWPASAVPLTPDDSAITDPDIDDSALDAIRRRASDAITEALGLVSLDQLLADPTLQAEYEKDKNRIGATEARRRAAEDASLIPRMAITLASQRRTLGGGADVRIQRFLDLRTEDGRAWSFERCAIRPITVTIDIRFRTEHRAEVAARKIAQELDRAIVVWPGAFNAHVLAADGTFPILRLRNGTWEQAFRLVGMEPAEWDDEANAAHTTVVATIDAFSPLVPATQMAGARQFDSTLTLASPAGGVPTITGRTTVGRTLRAGTAGIFDPAGLESATFVYQWYRISRDGTEAEILGATSATYRLVLADAGHTVLVRVSFTDDSGHPETRASERSAPVLNNPATGAPTITGTTTVGETLTAGTAEITDADGMTGVVFAYQWIRVDAGGTEQDIVGATGATYQLAPGDEFHTMMVRVSFDDDVGNAEQVTSGPTASVGT